VSRQLKQFKHECSNLIGANGCVSVALRFQSQPPWPGRPASKEKAEALAGWGTGLPVASPSPAHFGSLVPPSSPGLRSPLPRQGEGAFCSVCPLVCSLGSDNPAGLCPPQPCPAPGPHSLLRAPSRAGSRRARGRTSNGC